MQIFIYYKVTLHVSGVTAPSSGVLKTVTAACGTGHNIGTAISLQRGLIGTVAFAATVFSTRDVGCCDTRNM